MWILVLPLDSGVIISNVSFLCIHFIVCSLGIMICLFIESWTLSQLMSINAFKYLKHCQAHRMSHKEWSCHCSGDDGGKDDENDIIDSGSEQRDERYVSLRQNLSSAACRQNRKGTTSLLCDLVLFASVCVIKHLYPLGITSRPFPVVVKYGNVDKWLLHYRAWTTSKISEEAHRKRP